MKWYDILYYLTMIACNIGIIVLIVRRWKK